MSELKINYKESKEAWDSFVSDSPQRSIFVYTKFLDSIEAAYDLVTCYQGDNIVAGAAIIYSENGEPIHGPFPFTQYQGLLLADNFHMSANSRITHEFKVSSYFIENLTAQIKSYGFCNSWRLPDLRPFQWYNYHQPENGTFSLDLRYSGILEINKYTDFDDYLKNIRKVKRQEYTKASKLLEIEQSNDEKLLDTLHAKTFARQDIERPDGESRLLKSITRHALKAGYGKMCCAMLGDEPASAIFFLYDDRTAYYLFGANDPAHRKTYSGTFLLLNMIKDSFEGGVQEVDFLGLNSPNRGDFKISLNAELAPYFISSISC